jgi:2-oxoglutarate ferredoxin oxidoreductase subunit alpha
MGTDTKPPAQPTPIEEKETVTVRFAGDSGDGMQLAGTQFSNASAVFGNDINTLPDYPAEIRAPAGTLFGVSGYQINFSAKDISTPGDQLDALIAMNPAALKTNLDNLSEGGVLVVNTDAFTDSNLKKAHYDRNPLEDESLNKYKFFKVPITRLTVEAVKEAGLTGKQSERCKNFFSLGLVCWLFDRPVEPALKWINEKFGKTPAVLQANTLALRAGYAFGETAEMFSTRYHVKKAALPAGRYRRLTGNEGVALGMVAAARQAGLQLFYGSYPITPASEILHELSRLKNFGVITFQAEDEIAAMCAVIGAAFAGSLAVTGTSGPGLALKQEAIGLAVMTELPMVIVNVQRGGPSTGLPTKPEQADLLQAVFGRHGECPVPVLAALSPGDCFHMAMEAARIALKYMTPVLLMSDGYLAQGAEPWRIPRLDELPDLGRGFVPPAANGEKFQPYTRDENLARPWAIPGTKGREHRIGGLEKKDLTGDVCHEPLNHQLMVELRQKKVEGVAKDIPLQEVFGPQRGKLLVLGWGGSHGAIQAACQDAQDKGRDVAYATLRYLNPFPSNLGEILHSYDRVLIPELNMGQLSALIQAKYLVETAGLNKVQGRPFMIREITEKIDEMLSEVSS